MTISEKDLVRFKHAFLGIVAAKETPMLAHRVKLPNSVSSSQRVLKVLASLDTELDQLTQTADSKRTGTKALGTSWTKDKTSSIKQVTGAIGQMVNLDTLSSITQGKGLTEAQNALGKVKFIESQLQSAVVEDLFDQASQGATLKDSANLLLEAAGFLSVDGVAVPDGREKTVLAAGALLAKKLGLTEKKLRTGSPDELRGAYVDTVYMKLKIEKSANRDTGDLEPINSLLNQIGTWDEKDFKEGGEARALLTNLKAASLNNSIALNSSKAGKYSTGDAVTNKVTVPKAKNATKDVDLTVKGNKRFTDAVALALGDIGKTDAGKRLMEELSLAGKGVEINAPSLANAKRLDDQGNVQFTNSASNGKVAIDPENDVAGEDATPDKINSEPWRKREASVALYHEMIHVMIGHKGGEKWTAPSNDRAILSLSEQGDITELRIVGIDYEMDFEGQKVLFPFSSPAYNKITENAYRRDLARQKGETDVYLRPSYANVPGQKKLSGDKVPV